MSDERVGNGIMPGDHLDSGSIPGLPVTNSPVKGIDIRETWIPLPDGVRLAADLYCAAGAEPAPRPVLLEYLPYRKTEARARNLPMYAYFVEHGYVVARVDIRGTGNSEGRVVPHEYSDIELDDGEAVIAWLADQPWSNGKVGMFGISWGGFNPIMLASRKPRGFEAFVSLMATEDLYREDVHYVDGIIHTNSWLMSHDLYNAMPGAPDFRLDEDWLRDRFEVEPSAYIYVRNQRENPFWDRASSLDKYQRIAVPGFHIGGWYDGYRNSLPRMLEHCVAPVKAMIGPWDHYFPHNAWPQPRVEWRFEAVRWFDHWLKGEDTGILDEPAFAVFVRDHHPPDPGLQVIPGRWRWEESWPPQRLQWQPWHASSDHALGPARQDAAIHELPYVASQGLEGGGPVMWWGNIPPDQQAMDDHCLVYDSEPLDQPLEILGRPVARLKVSADAPRGNWFVRIGDVAPDGRVTQVSGLGFNGTHRESAREPRDIVPGQAFELAGEMMFTSWVFPAGHRVRVAISVAQWPMYWPTPHPFTGSLHVGGDNGTRVDLPVITAGNGLPEPVFRAPWSGPQMPGFETLDSGNVSGYGEIASIQRDPETGQAYGEAINRGSHRYPWGTERFTERIEHRVNDRDPALASTRGYYALTQELEDRSLRFEQDIDFSSDPDHFRLVMTRRVLVDDQVAHEKTWDETIPRDFQ